MGLRATDSPSTTRNPGDVEGNASPAIRDRIGPNGGWLFLSGSATWVFYFSAESVAETAGCGSGAGAFAMWAFLALVGLTLVVLGHQVRTTAAAVGRIPASTARAGSSIGVVLVGACLLLGVPALFSTPC